MYVVIKSKKSVPILKIEKVHSLFNIKTHFNRTYDMVLATTWTPSSLTCLGVRHQSHNAVGLRHNRTFSFMECMPTAGYSPSDGRGIFCSPI